VKRSSSACEVVYREGDGKQPVFATVAGTIKVTVKRGISGEESLGTLEVELPVRTMV